MGKVMIMIHHARRYLYKKRRKGGKENEKGNEARESQTDLRRESFETTGARGSVNPKDDRKRRRRSGWNIAREGRLQVLHETAYLQPSVQLRLDVKVLKQRK